MGRNSVLVAGLVLAGVCAIAVTGRPAPVPVQAAENRPGAVLHSRTPISTGEILDIRLPNVMLPDEQLLDERCIVYRDTELRTASVSCFSQPADSGP